MIFPLLVKNFFKGLIAGKPSSLFGIDDTLSFHVILVVDAFSFLKLIQHLELTNSKFPTLATTG